MMVCPNCAAEIQPSMRFCAECGLKLDHGQSTVSFAPSFGEEAEKQAVASGDGAGEAALIELDQVEGTAGRRMHDIDEDVVTVTGLGGRPGGVDQMCRAGSRAQLLYPVRPVQVDRRCLATCAAVCRILDHHSDPVALMDSNSMMMLQAEQPPGVLRLAQPHLHGGLVGQ